MTAHRAESYLDGFDYGSATKLSTIDQRFYEKLRENMKAGWPAQIAIGGGFLGLFRGHSIVVDGYDESGMFHLNFGQVTLPEDTWYSLPEDLATVGFNTVRDGILDISPYSAWSQDAADERNTCRSPYSAPSERAEPARRWMVTCLPKYDGTNYVFNGLVVGAGNRIYASSSRISRGTPYIYVISRYGIVECTIPIQGEQERIGHPAQGTNGDVFVGSGQGAIYRLNPDAMVVTKVFQEPGGEGFVGALKVDRDDRIYACTWHRLYCIDPSTSTAVDFDPPGPWEFSYSPALDSDRNNVYVTYFDRDQRKSCLACLNRQTLQPLWEKVFEGIESGTWAARVPSVRPDGTVYVGCHTVLYALAPEDGAVKASRDFSPGFGNYFRAIGYDGTIYLPGDDIPGGQPVLRALRPQDLSSKWEYRPEIGGDSWSAILGAYAARNDVMCFTLYCDGEYWIYGIRDLGDVGELLWKAPYGGGIAFGPGATLYTWSNNTIYALSQGERGDPDGLAMGWENNKQPAQPHSPSPADPSADVPTDLTLSWDCSDPEGHDLKYDVLLGDSTSMMLPVVGGIGEKSHAVRNLTPATQYLWKVVASDGQAKTEGPVWTFRTFDFRLSALSYEPDGSLILRWSSTPGGLYVVESSESLPGSWVAASPQVPSAGTTTEWKDMPPPETRCRFYRIRLGSP